MTARDVIAEWMLRNTTASARRFAELKADDLIETLSVAPEPVRLELAALLLGGIEDKPPVTGRPKSSVELAALLNPWRPIETVPKDRYVLLFDPTSPNWDGNMDVGRWFGGDDGCFWSCGGPNGGLELGGLRPPGPGGEKPYTHWCDLPAPPSEDKT